MGSLRVNQPLRPPPRRATLAPGASGPAWPSYTGNAELIGRSSADVAVYVDPALGDQGRQSAQQLLAAADAVVQQNNAIFAIHGVRWT